MVSGAVICQIQEFSRYTRSTFVGIVHGYGNARGDVHRDPNDPWVRRGLRPRVFYEACE